MIGADTSNQDINPNLHQLMQSSHSINIGQYHGAEVPSSLQPLSGPVPAPVIISLAVAPLRYTASVMRWIALLPLRG